ncbi:MAG: STAS domain-containing protein [Fimbriimonadales bacterium]
MLEEIHNSKVRTSEDSRALIIEVTGDVGRNAPSAESLIRRADESRSQIAIVDLSKAETIDTEGLQWLEQVTTTLEPAGVKVRVVTSEGSKVRRILKLMRFDRFMVVLATVFDALTFGKRHK